MRDLVDGGRTTQAAASFTRDTGKIWNTAPQKIKNTKTLATAKKEIKSYCKTLQIEIDLDKHIKFMMLNVVNRLVCQ